MKSKTLEKISTMQNIISKQELRKFKGGNTASGSGSFLNTIMGHTQVLWYASDEISPTGITYNNVTNQPQFFTP